MEIPIIRIGNSKGILLSKVLMERYKFGNKIELTMRRNHLELKPVKAPREGWAAQFKKMHAEGADQLFIDRVLEDEYFDEWE